MRTPLTTLCYIEENNSYLMLHRVKKENDMNKDKWVGVGGKLSIADSSAKIWAEGVAKGKQLE